MAIELWSWLKKNAKRQQFYCKEGCNITSSDFMQKVTEKLEENNVPATITNTTIKWDGSTTTSAANVLRIESAGTANPFSCLVQFSIVGKFAFVEEKLFITPPNLPEPPEEQEIIDEDMYKRRGLILWAIVALIAGIFLMKESVGIGFLAIIIGAALGFFGITAFLEIKAAKEHNEWCQRVLEDWIAEWKRWEETIYLHSFQEGTNGRTSRIYDAVYASIRQVCAEVFPGKQVQEYDESFSMSELALLIANRKEEYK